MQRGEIMSKYKAKMRYCNKWIYGKLKDDKFLKSCIDDEVEGKRAIDPSTLCEDTEYLDKNNYKVFVNDFVKKDLSIGIVVRKNNDFYIRWGRIKFEKLKYSTDFEVCGNKYYKY